MKSRPCLSRPCRGARALLGVLAFGVVGASPLPAQQTGRIIGRVVDATTGDGLAAARLLVVGTDRSVLAGADGRFLLLGVPAGEVSIEAAMMGYARAVVPGIVVPAGGTVERTIALAPEAVRLDAIEVSAPARRGSAVAALEGQRLAAGVTSTVSAEQISRTPDGSAAAAIQRVAGVAVQEGKYVFVRGLGERYTTASLNGARIPSPEPERKVVPLDLFPAGLLQMITTSKSFTPDQPGDFSGGQVDIRTRDFTTRRHRSFSASLGYTGGVTGRVVPVAPRAGGEWLAFGAGARRLPGEAGAAAGELRRGPAVNRVVNAFRNTWSVRRETALPNLSLGFSLGGNDELLGRHVGHLLSATYSAGTAVRRDERRARAGIGGTERDRYDGTTGTFGVLWGGLANFSVLLGERNRILLNNTLSRSAENEARIEEGTDENTRAHVRIERLRYVERAVRSHQLAGEHHFAPRRRLDWALAYAGVRRAEPDRSEFVTWLDPEVPVWFNDPEGAVRSFAELEERSLQATVDYRIEWGEGAGPWRLKVGGLYRAAEREAAGQGFQIQAYDWSTADPRWQLPPEEFFDGRFATEADANFLLSRVLAGGRYGARERIAAAYGMLEVPLGTQVRLIGGARVEHTALVVDAENNLGQPSRSAPTYTDLLPSAIVTLDLTDRQKVRLSATRTLARPEYRELAPITYREVLGGEQVVGNAGLRRTRIQNYDARWAFYPAPGEVVSVGVFGKWFRDPIEQRFLARSGTDTRTFENAESAVDYGIEVEVAARLGRLAPWLDPVSAFANVTLMESEVRTGVPDDEPRAMVGQAPYVVNAGLTYGGTERGLGVTVLYNVVGPRITNARASGTQVDNVVEQPRHQLDLSIRVPVSAGAALKLDVRNLLDARYEVRQGDVVRAYHRTGRSASIGLSWQP